MLAPLLIVISPYQQHLLVSKEAIQCENNDVGLIFVDLLVSSCEKSDGSLTCSPSACFNEVELGEEVRFDVCMLMFVSSSILTICMYLIVSLLR